MKLMRMLSNRRVVLALLLISLPILAASGTYLISNKSPLPQDVISSSPARVYYPAELPNNFKLINDSAKVSGGITTYSLQHKVNNNSLVITIQRSPKNFDPNRFSDSISDTFNLSIGTAYNASNAQRTAYFILTPDDNLISVSSTTKINDASVRNILQELKPIN